MWGCHLAFHVSTVPNGALNQDVPMSWPALMIFSTAESRKERLILVPGKVI